MSGIENLTRIRSPISVLTGPDVDNFVDRSQRTNHYARPPDLSPCLLVICAHMASCSASMNYSVFIMGLGPGRKRERHKKLYLYTGWAKKKGPFFKSL